VENDVVLTLDIKKTEDILSRLYKRKKVRGTNNKEGIYSWLLYVFFGL